MHRLVLEDVFKTFTLDQDKALPPDETVRRFREDSSGFVWTSCRRPFASTTAASAFPSI